MIGRAIRQSHIRAPHKRTPLLATPLLRVEGLVKHFPVTQGIIFQRQIAAVKAVDGVSFAVREGETLGVVGESG